MMPAVNVDDLRVRARRRLPRAVFDFIDGGAGDERTLAANRRDLDAITLSPRVLTDVSRREMSTTIFGRRLELPLLFAPTGMTGLASPKGELPAARAAAAAGVGYCLSINATSSIEEVAAETGAPFWFQLYPLRDRDMMHKLIERAGSAGCDALIVTVDLPVQGKRERDVRNGFTIPPRVSLSDVVRLLATPRWLWDMALGPRLTFANFGTGSGFVELAKFIGDQFDPSFAWPDLADLKRLWKGPLLVKGVLHADDARRALDHGADGIIVSNHGGRQLDGVASAISALPRIVDAVAGRAPVLLDGGIRRGIDLIRARALGAQACLIGRPFLYALAAQGATGPARVIELLRDELDNAMALLGQPSFNAIGSEVLQPTATA